MTLIDLIASFDDDKTAIVHPDSDIRLTYGLLRNHVRVLASALVDAGARRGDRIAIALPNGAPLVTAVLAASTIGVALPLRPNSEGRFDGSVENTRAHVVVDGDGIRVTVPSNSSAEATLETALIVESRGTTGRPKRVPLTHANLTIAATSVVRSLSLSPNDVSLCVMPVAHVHGLVTATLATLASGGTVVMPRAFHPVTFWRVARDHGVTWYSATPALHQWLLARTADPGARRPAGAARLRFIRSSGAMLPPAVRQTLESAFRVPLVEGYEVTEASGEVASSSPTGKLRPRAELQIAVVNDSSRVLGQGVTGEVALAGPTVARGYDNDPEATRKFFVDGWFRTGDFGYLDADGCLTLAGEQG